MERWSLPKELCTKLVRDAGSNMTAAARTLRVDHMCCIAHALHLVVGGMLIKSRKSRRKKGSSTSRRSNPVVSNHNPVSGLDDVSDLDDTELEGEFICDGTEEGGLDEQELAGLDGLQSFAEDELNLFLDETLERMKCDEMEDIPKVVQRFRSLATYFRKSPKARHRLCELQVEMGVDKADVLALKIDCPTRWNSCWDMLQRFISLESALTRFFVYLETTEGRKEFKDTRRKLTRPMAKDWLVIKCLRSLLAPFAVATATLSGQAYPTAPLVMPALSGIRHHLEQTRMFDREYAAAGAETYVAEAEIMMVACRKNILELFKNRFAALEESELMWVAYLDPRIAKRMAHLHASDTSNACAALVNEMVALAKSSEPLSPSTTTTATFLSPVPAPFAAEKFMNDHMFGPDIQNTAVVDLERACVDEFKRYLSDAAIVQRDDDPFVWWRGNCQKFPNLSRVARKWLGTVATSVPSERAFSTSGNIVTARRSALSPEMVRDLVFVSDNWRMHTQCIRS